MAGTSHGGLPPAAPATRRPWRPRPSVRPSGRRRRAARRRAAHSCASSRSPRGRAVRRSRRRSPVAQFVADEHLEAFGAFGRRLARADVIAHREAALHLDVRPPRQRHADPLSSASSAPPSSSSSSSSSSPISSSNNSRRASSGGRRRLERLHRHATSSFAPQKARAWTTPRSHTDAYGAAASAAAAAGLAAGSAKSCTRAAPARSTARARRRWWRRRQRARRARARPPARATPRSPPRAAPPRRGTARCGAPPWSCIVKSSCTSVVKQWSCGAARAVFSSVGCSRAPTASVLHDAFFESASGNGSTASRGSPPTSRCCCAAASSAAAAPSPRAPPIWRPAPGVRADDREPARQHALRLLRVRPHPPASAAPACPPPAVAWAGSARARRPSARAARGRPVDRPLRLESLVLGCEEVLRDGQRHRSCNFASTRHLRRASPCAIELRSRT